MQLQQLANHLIGSLFASAEKHLQRLSTRLPVQDPNYGDLDAELQNSIVSSSVREFPSLQTGAFAFTDFFHWSFCHAGVYGFTQPGFCHTGVSQ
jgi:hypothetical protein